MQAEGLGPIPSNLFHLCNSPFQRRRRVALRDQTLGTGSSLGPCRLTYELINNSMQRKPV